MTRNAGPPRGVIFAVLALVGTLAAAPATAGPTTATQPPVTPAPGPGLCAVTGRQTVDRARVERGQAVGVSLTFAASCPVEARGRADVLLLIDRSASMADNGKHQAALAAVQDFINRVDFARHRVGLVPFNDAPSVVQTLTDRQDRLQRALENSPTPAGSTDIARALAVADAELEVTARREAVGVLVLLTDGQSNEEAMYEAADRIRRRGTVIFTVGLGADANQMALRHVATTADYYNYAPGPEELAGIYNRIANIIQEFTVTDIHLVDRPASGVTYLPGRGSPFEPATDGDLDWRFAFVPAGGVTVTYQVRLTPVGQIPVSEQVGASYVDGDGVLRRLDYPPAQVEVFAPTIRPFFLPITYRGHCLPAARHVDVALVIDVSSSMSEDDKLPQAVAAAKAFLRLLKLPADQAAVVTFHNAAKVNQLLTGDRSRLESQLDALTTYSGTRLDLGLDLATAELMGPRHAAGNLRVVVLLSDGRQTEEPERVYASADFARRLGVSSYAIALGKDADEGTLQTVAGSPDRFFRAARAQDLVAIYTQIAGVVACR